MNLYPENSGIRVGYHGFISMVWVLWRMNRESKLTGFKHKVEITFPVRWFR